MKFKKIVSELECREGFRYQVVTDSCVPISGENVQSNVTTSPIEKQPLNRGTSPSITVLSPNGGEQFQIGKNFLVTWDINGGSKDVQHTAYIYLVDQTNKEFHLWTANPTKNSISVPAMGANGDIMPGKYKLKIDLTQYQTCTTSVPSSCSVEPILGTDMGDDYFTITN